MPRIRCHYEDCIFLESGYCTADRIELDPETGCLTYQQADEVEAPVAEWEEEEEEVADEEEEVEEDEEVEWDEDEEEEDDDEEEEW
ncbi:MAG TPA: hypothetical protein VJG32_21260 [Anaerolineae bacterium]|nr:hypothetical protein [Anaerolineae bacterium]